MIIPTTPHGGICVVLATASTLFCNCTSMLAAIDFFVVSGGATVEDSPGSSVIMNCFEIIGNDGSRIFYWKA